MYTCLYERSYGRNGYVSPLPPYHPTPPLHLHASNHKIEIGENFVLRGKKKSERGENCLYKDNLNEDKKGTTTGYIDVYELCVQVH